MKFTKIDLLTLLIGLFLFASCKDSSTVGLDLDPADAVQGIKADTLSVNSTTQAEQLIQTNTLTAHPLGYISDPIFGTTESEIAMAVNMPAPTKYDFGINPVLDSAILVMNYAGRVDGDTAASVYSFDVRQLSLNISAEEAFLNNRVYPSYNVLWGSKSTELRPTTKFKITDIVPGKSDTLKGVTPQLRIPLINSVVQANILNSTFISGSDFVKIFGGLKVSINKTASSGPLGIAFFDFAGMNSKLELYFKKDKAGGGRDTVLAEFPISTSRNPVAATFTHNYTGTAVATQLSNPSVQYPITYLQGLAGVRTKISFPHLQKFANSVGKIVINKAELVVPISTGTDGLPFAAAKRLGLYRTDIAGQRQDITDRLYFAAQYGDTAGGDPFFGGYFDSLKKQYVFIVTNYIQQLLDGRETDYGTYLMVTPQSEFLYQTPSGSSAERVVIGSGAKNPAGTPINPTNKIQLNIYYTKVN